MNRPVTRTSHPIIPLPRVPAWAVPRSTIDSDVEAAYMAGSALNSLDNLVRSDVPWLGAWRQRLALKAAAASVKLMRRTEDESALRDAWYLRQPGDDPGPAGKVLSAWRKLADRSLPSSVEDLQSLADLLGITWTDAFVDRIEDIADDVRSMVPAPLIAARAAQGVFEARPGITGLAQVNGIDMSTPELLAETDRKMLVELNMTAYFRYLLMTVLGKGGGDRIKRF